MDRRKRARPLRSATQPGGPHGRVRGEVRHPPASRTLRTAYFPGVGPVDLALIRPRAVRELKRSYALSGRVFVSAWGLVKLALLGERFGYEASYMATGASSHEWDATESADLLGTKALVLKGLFEARPAGFEPAASCSGGKRSIH